MEKKQASRREHRKKTVAARNSGLFSLCSHRVSCFFSVFAARSRRAPFFFSNFAARSSRVAFLSWLLPLRIFLGFFGIFGSGKLECPDSGIRIVRNSDFPNFENRQSRNSGFSRKKNKTLFWGARRALVTELRRKLDTRRAFGEKTSQSARTPEKNSRRAQLGPFFLMFPSRVLLFFCFCSAFPPRAFLFF